MKKNNLVERIHLTFEKFTELEKGMLLQEHLRRYASIRRFCYGKVLDFACGCGYGSYLVAGNPDVSSVLSVDRDKDAVLWGKNEFSHKKIKYSDKDIFSHKGKFDTLVCLETIEHIKDVTFISKIVDKYNIDNLIISFPDKKTTHYNSFHFHDFVRQEVLDLFKNHIVYHSLRFMDSQSLMLIRLPQKAPSDIFRNIKDLN